MLIPSKLRSMAKRLSAALSASSADRLRRLEQRWRNWLATSISNRIIFFAISLTMMIVIIIGVISYSAINALIRQNINASLESQTQLVEQSVQFALNAFVQDIADLAANSLVTNGLLDSQGREIYLLPFLRDHKMPVPVEVEITLSDFQGVPIASNQQTIMLRSYKDTAVVRQAIETGKPRAEIFRNVQGHGLLLVQPVLYPATGRAEGALIARMSLQDVFEKATSFFTVKLHKHLIIDGVDLNTHKSKDETLIQVYKHLQLVPPLDSLNLQVMVDQKRGEALAVLNLVTLIYLTLGAGTLWLVLRLARIMARRLTLPLSALSQIANQIAASGSLRMKAEVTGIDEVGNLGSVFNEMLNKLHASHELLELRVTERTQELKHAEQRLSSILGSVRDIIRSSSLDGKEIIYLNEAVESIFEQPLQAFFGNPRLWMEMIDPEDQQIVASGMLCLWEKGQCELLYRIIRPSGKRRWLLDREQIIYDEHNKPIRLDGIVTDITERKEAEEELHQAHQSLKALIQTSPLAVYTYDLEGYVTLWNPAATRMFGWTEDEVIGRFLPFVQEEKKEEFRTLREKISGGEYVTNVEFIRQKRDGSSIHISISAAPLYDAHEKLTGIMGIAADITERKAVEERIRHLAEHDFLTGLPNRVLLRDRLDQAIAHEHDHRKIALLFLDLDRFKNVNDSLGHHIGDKLLQSVGERLKSCVRGSDTVSRQGGDEFIIMMPDIENTEAAARAAEKLLAAVAKPYFIDGHDLGISTSIGISIYPDDGVDLDTLLKNIDAAMYHAKERGRNNYQFFAQDMNMKALEKLTLQNSLRRALERGEFLLHYQPQVNIVSEQIVGVEALIRWQHPELGLVPPAKFIPIAEDSGLIIPIGEWVLREACRQNKKWQEAGLPQLRMAVNLSAHQFRQYNLVETAARVLTETGLDAQYLELELTESLIMQHVEETITTLEKLSAMGVQISIDDFGTGYSSLSYLKRFPIDRLKIDQSFVQDITVDPDDAAINSAIIAMAKSLKLKVIAEGVETREQLIFLRGQKCDEAQGYYFSKPVPAEKFVQLFNDGQQSQQIAI